jgi:hypothetical protein
VFPAAAAIPSIPEIAPEAPINTVWLFPNIKVDITPKNKAPASPAIM